MDVNVYVLQATEIVFSVQLPLAPAEPKTNGREFVKSWQTLWTRTAPFFSFVQMV